MKIRLLSPEYNLNIGNVNTSEGNIDSVVVLKTNHFIILEAFGVTIQTDLIVSGLTATNGSSTEKVSLQWNARENVDGYKIFKYPRQLLSTQTGITYDDYNQTAGILTNYYVKTFVIKDELVYDSKPVYATGWKKLTPPVLVASGEQIEDPAIPVVALNWNAVDGATAYKIFKTQGSDLSKFKLYGITSNTNVIDKKINFGKLYTYAIKSSSSLGDSEYSNIQSISVLGQVPDQPSVVTVSAGDYSDKIKVSWTTVPNTLFYNVYKDTQFNRIATNITETNFDDITVAVDELHSYGVGAQNDNGEGLIKFSAVSGWRRLPSPNNFTVSDGNYTNKIKLNWDTVQGATGYLVYKGTPLVQYSTQIKGITYEDNTGISYGVIYTYGVQAIGDLGNSDITTDTGYVAQSAPELAPTGVSASDGSYTDKVKITWNPITSIQGISGYKVFKDSNLLTLSELTNIDDTSAIPGTAFTYTVKGYNLAGDGPSSSGNTGWIGLSNTTSFTASKKQSQTQIFLNWSVVNGATLYKVFKGTPSSLAQIDQTPNTNYTDSGLSDGVTFAYAVKASCVLGDGDFSNIDIGQTGVPIPLPNPPTGVSASDGAYTDKVKITWNVVSGVSGYVVYRDGTQAGTVSEQATNEFFDTSVFSGILFDYSVASTNETGIGNKSTSNSGWRGLVPPQIVTASNDFKDKIKLDWSTVNGATAYKIYTGKSFNPDINVVLLGVTSSLSFLDFTPTFGQGYTYAIKSSCALGDSAQYSTPVLGYVAQSPPESAPTGISASDGAYTDKIIITWTPPTTIMGISGYNVYRTIKNTNQTVNFTTSIPFIDTTTLSGTTFEYKVSAVNLAGEGPISSVDTGWKALEAPSGFIASKGTFSDKVRLTWVSVGPGISYTVYKGNPLLQLTTTSSTSYDDTAAAAFPGITLQYAIKAFTSLPIESNFSNTDIGFIQLSAPQNITASNGIFTDKVKITWDGFSGAQQYKIYKDGFILIGTTFSNSFGDTLAAPGITYTYYVSTFLPGFVYESTKSSGVTGWKKPQAPTNFIASKNDYNDKIKLSWNGVTGITTYKIYKAISFTPEIGSILVGITNNTYFFDTTAPKNVLTKYAVKASGNAGDSDYSNSDDGIFTSIVFYDGISGTYPIINSSLTADRTQDPDLNILGSEFMPYMQIADPYWLWYNNGNPAPGLSTGWTSFNLPSASLRFGEGYDTGAFNYVTKREIDGLVKSLILQGLTKTSSNYIYLNWTEDQRDLGHFGFGSMTGPDNTTDLISFDGETYVKQSRALISENATLSRTYKQNFAELCGTFGKIFLGGTGTDGITFRGLKYYFPNCKFGIYNWPMWGYYFSGGQYDVVFIPPNELTNRTNLVADAFIEGMGNNIDAIDMFMPSLYSVLNSAEYNKARNTQAINLCTTINNKLKLLGKSNKLIIPFVCPLYLTDHTGDGYNTNKTSLFSYIPPYTIQLDNDMQYEQIEPTITGGGHGASIWINAPYTSVGALGRITNGTLEDTAPQPDWLKWPFLHPGGTTAGINQWSTKSMLRQAVSAHYNYTKGVCLGVTGNRWWWATASKTTTPSSAETFTPTEWLPLGTSFAPYGNKVAYSSNPSDAGATTINAASINIVKQVYEDTKSRMIKVYNNIVKSKNYYGPNTQTWKLPSITNSSSDTQDYSSIGLGHSPVIFYTTKDGTVGYIARDIQRIYNLDCDLTPPANIGKCKQVVVGYQNATALRTNGTLVSWGKLNGMTAGIVNETAYFQQQLTAKGRTVKKIAAGAGHIVVLLDTGEVVTYGSNEAAQLSDPNTVWSPIGLIPRPTAADHKYITGFTAYASYEYLQDASSYLETTSANSCIANPDPLLRYRKFRFLNPGCTLHATFPQGGYDTPYVFNGITYPGPEFTSQGGFAWAGKINWRPITGAPYDYQFSRATTGDPTSVNFSLNGGWTQGSEHIPTNDSLLQGYSLAPNSVFGTAGITYLDIAANRSNSMALTNKGTIHIWGWNYYYNVTGSGSQTQNGASGWSREGSGEPAGNAAEVGWGVQSAYIPAKPRPIPPAPFGDNNYQTVKNIKTIPGSVKGIGMGYYTQYVIKNDGSLFAWDRNEWGQSLPLKNSEGTSGLPTGTFKQVSGGYHHSIALRDNGTVVCWGENNDGECDVPANLGNDVVWVGASSRASFALKADGTLVGWGGMENFTK